MRPSIKLLAHSLLLLCAFGCSVTDAQEMQSGPSAFDTILSRVSERDPQTDAILSIAAFSDAPDPGARYSITIKPISRSPDVLVELRGLSNPQVVYESYRLRSTTAIDAEREKLSLASRTAKGTDKKPEFVFLRITHLRQGVDLCAPTSASMALLHFGERIPPERVKALANSVTTRPDFAGTYFEDMVNGLKQIGITWDLQYFKTDQQGFDAGLKAIIANLDKGGPVIIDTNVAPHGHTVLVNGYDPRRELISIVDPLIAAPGLRHMSYAEFEKQWRSLTADIRGAIFTSRPEKLKQNEGPQRGGRTGALGSGNTLLPAR